LYADVGNELDGWGEARNARICTHLLPVIADHISITSFEDRLSCKESSPWYISLNLFVPINSFSPMSALGGIFEKCRTGVYFT
jgi:hypothetical protein